LQVFGEAPGGWYQVGQDGTAWGWLHASVLDGPARYRITLNVPAMTPRADQEIASV
jgi:hypothetical protein